MTDQTLLAQLQMLIDIGIALSNERDVEVLLEKILLSAKSISAADGGTLYKIENNFICSSIIHSDSLHIHLGGSSGNSVNLPKLPLYLEDGSCNLSHVVCYSYHKHCVVNIADVYDPNDDFDFSGPKQFDLKFNYKTKSLLTIPLKNHKDHVIGILQLVNALDRDSKTVTGFNPVSENITTAMAAQAAILLTQQQLIVDLEKLFQSLVKLVATAVDKKSPYTGAHSRRVPVLTMLLADAVHETEQGVFKDFTLSPADRNELEVAAWLHDCGKITTPEFVMDKATKLETIVDRIILLETRFEVLKRDQEILLLKTKLASMENGKPVDDALTLTYQENLAKIADDLAFIQRINLGAESMSTADQERVIELSKRSWTFNGEESPLLTADEVKNLNIYRGTLTNEERTIINHHIVATIAMLEAIEFPSHLKKVPEFAGGHHERMDGRGYPRGLTREQMSVQARIMGIADVFEALMDADRPYKKGKKLSEALAILKDMQENGHIDPDLYDVFINKKIYKKYVDMFVAPAQIDLE